VLKFMLILVAAAPFVCFQSSVSPSPIDSKLTLGKTSSSDGVSIAYVACGKGEAALVFIHGGLADRTFWSNQLEPLAGQHRVVALDLGGHGASGRNRKQWTLESLGRDVEAVVERERLRSVILVGNSLGGAVALEAARLLPGRVVGVIAVDTCHDFSARMDPAALRQRAESFRKDFPSACDAMAQSLFHPDADPKLAKDVKTRFRRASPEVLASLLESFGTYDGARAAMAARVPIYCLNGDLFPTRSDSNRKIVPEFKAVIMRHAGHFPMLERPEEFNAKLVELVGELEQKSAQLRARRAGK